MAHCINNPRSVMRSDSRSLCFTLTSKNRIISQTWLQQHNKIPIVVLMSWVLRVCTQLSLGTMHAWYLACHIFWFFYSSCRRYCLHSAIMLNCCIDQGISRMRLPEYLRTHAIIFVTCESKQVTRRTRVGLEVRRSFIQVKWMLRWLRMCDCSPFKSASISSSGAWSLLLSVSCPSAAGLNTDSSMVSSPWLDYFLIRLLHAFTRSVSSTGHNACF